MSLIGTLEQINLGNLLQRLEIYAKSGLLVVQQGTQWVELYFRDGRLMCVGPVRTNATLGARLLQDGLISQRALQETLYAIGAQEPSETRMALTLMDLGYVTQEQLRNWATRKAHEVLHVLLAWGSGDVYFEENFAPPTDRLLVAIAVSVLLPVIAPTLVQSPPVTEVFIAPESAMQPAKAEQLSHAETLQPRLTRASEIPNVPTLLEPEQFGMEAGASSTNRYSYGDGGHADFPGSGIFPPMASGIFANPEPQVAAMGMGVGTERTGNSYIPVFEGFGEGDSGGEGLGGMFKGDDQAFVSFLEEGSGSDSLGSGTGRRQPEPISTVYVPRRIDVSFMQPEMILLPVDFTAALAQNPAIHMTPEQWMIFALVDGQNSLQSVCMSIGMHSSQVCQVVGELLAEGLIQLGMPDGKAMKELSPLGRDAVVTGMNNGYIAPGYASMPVPGWSSGMPMADVAPRARNGGFEAQSQWGNGANGASFKPGQGWIASPQSLQPLPVTGVSGMYTSNKGYVPLAGK